MKRNNKKNEKEISPVGGSKPARVIQFKKREKDKEEYKGTTRTKKKEISPGGGSTPARRNQFNRKEEGKEEEKGTP